MLTKYLIPGNLHSLSDTTVLCCHNFTEFDNELSVWKMHASSLDCDDQVK